mmetsp:Transcript_59834/g.142240  ORF Transcript_59834/g.142240 Transcript_59834/m.142240 type:complete len:384 (+) Transcript_59834:181-1332(+)
MDKSSGKPHIGIILRLRKDTGTLQVIGLAPNGPAKQGGLIQEDDVVLKIAGQAVGGMSAEIAAPMLEGALGSRVRLKLSREGVPFDCTLSRAVVTTSQPPPTKKLSKKSLSNASEGGSGSGASHSKKLTDREKADKLLGKGTNKVYGHDGNSRKHADRLSADDGARARSKQEEVLARRQLQADREYDGLMDSEMDKAKATQAAAMHSIGETISEDKNQLFGSIRSLLGFSHTEEGKDGGRKHKSDPAGPSKTEHAPFAFLRPWSDNGKEKAEQKTSSGEQAWFAKLAQPFAAAPPPPDDRPAWKKAMDSGKSNFKSKVKETKKRTAAFAMAAYLEHRIRQVNAELWDAAWGEEEEEDKKKKKKGGEASGPTCGLCSCSSKRTR